MRPRMMCSPLLKYDFPYNSGPHVHGNRSDPISTEYLYSTRPPPVNVHLRCVVLIYLTPPCVVLSCRCSDMGLVQLLA